MLVQSDADRLRIQEKVSTHLVYVHPIYVNQYLHPSVAEVSMLHLLFEDGEYVCLPYSHLDARSILPITFANAKHVIGVYLRDIVASTDTPADRIEEIASWNHFVKRAGIPQLDSYYSGILRELSAMSFKKINLAIPLVKWMECVKQFLVELSTIRPTRTHSAYKFMMDSMLPSLLELESAGLHIDIDAFQHHAGTNKSVYINNSFIFTRYNPYFVTGRSSNAYGGVNFAALSKTSGIRDSFTSRFGESGLLVQFDYEAFHLRILASLMNYELPANSAHQYLAQQYYGTENISEEQYSAAKENTFSIMYGYSNDTFEIPFFERMQQFRIDLWKQYRAQSYILAPISGRELRLGPDATENQLFNYLMQAMEADYAITGIKQLQEYIKQHQLASRAILYTYDAVLLDIPAKEVRYIADLQKCLELGGIFPTRRYIGQNYGNLNLQKD